MYGSSRSSGRGGRGKGSLTSTQKSASTSTPSGGSRPVGSTEKGRSRSHRLTLQEDKKGNMFWGPAYWKTIHTACAAYRPEKRESFLLWIYSFPDQIPCTVCAKHMVKNLQAFPPDDWADTRDNLFLWSYRFHDMVNRSKDPPTPSPQFSHVKRLYYEGIYSCTTCNSDD
jgi:hypothetical protein